MDPGRSARAAEPSAQRSLGRNANNRGSTAKDQAGSVTRFRRKDAEGLRIGLKRHASTENHLGPYVGKHVSDQARSSQALAASQLARACCCDLVFSFDKVCRPLTNDDARRHRIPSGDTRHDRAVRNPQIADSVYSQVPVDH